MTEHTNEFQHTFVLGDYTLCVELERAGIVAFATAMNAILENNHKQIAQWKAQLERHKHG